MRPTFAQAHPAKRPEPLPVGRFLKGCFWTAVAGFLIVGAAQAVDLSKAPHLRAFVQCTQVNAGRVVQALKDHETPHLRECGTGRY